MKLTELKERVDHALENAGNLKDNITVCIPNNKGGMGGTSCTNVKNAYQGFDWDMTTFFIEPETKMIESDV